jgi:hypothetical protein
MKSALITKKEKQLIRSFLSLGKVSKRIWNNYLSLCTSPCFPISLNTSQFTSKTIENPTSNIQQLTRNKTEIPLSLSPHPSHPINSVPTNSLEHTKKILKLRKTNQSIQTCSPLPRSPIDQTTDITHVRASSGER